MASFYFLTRQHLFCNSPIQLKRGPRRTLLVTSGFTLLANPPHGSNICFLRFFPFPPSVLIFLIDTREGLRFFIAHPIRRVSPSKLGPTQVGSPDLRLLFFSTTFPIFFPFFYTWPTSCALPPAPKPCPPSISSVIFYPPSAWLLFC